MKVHILYLLLLFSFFSTSSFGSLTGWKLSRDTENVKVWQLISNSDVTGSLEIRESKKRVKWADIKSESFFEKLKKKKQKILSFIGIRNWIADSYKWDQESDCYVLEVVGSYVDSKGIKTRFRELHLFYPQKTVQILHTRPSDYKKGKKYSEDIIRYIKSITAAK